MSQAEYEVIVDAGCQMGNSPVWHPHEHALYWSDTQAGKLWRWSQADGSEVVDEGVKIGGLTVQADGALLLFREHGNIVIWDRGQVRSVVVDHIPGHEEERFNDVYADPMGRVYAGTVCEGMMGRLIRLDVSGDWHEVLSGIACSFGMDLTVDQKRMYYTDRTMRAIWSYTYDQSTGGLYDRDLFMEMAEGEGFPGGLTVDRDGNVWSARWGGWGVYHYDADGKEKKYVELPAKYVTSLCFGGEDYKDLFVTSACCNERGQEEGDMGEDAGAVFKLKVKAAGKMPNLSRISK